MKPTTKASEEEIAKLIGEEISKRVVPLGEKMEEISVKLMDREKKLKEEKIEEIMDRIKNKSLNKIPEIPKETLERNLKEETLERKLKEEKIEEIMAKIKDKKNTHNHDDIDCPTCGKGHVHKMTESGRLKCTGDKCGEEFLIIPTHADAFCFDCGLPLKKPEEGKKIESCPGCGGKKASMINKNGVPGIKFDFSKIKK